jgi:hypothetical protein
MEAFQTRMDYLKTLNDYNQTAIELNIMLLNAPGNITVCRCAGIRHLQQGKPQQTFYK